MSEGITHTAILDDNIRLIQQATSICAPFREVLGEYREIARLGAITRHGDRHTPRLLKTLRATRHNGEGESEWRKTLAFVLGWLSHRAADRQTKRIFRSVDGDCPHRPTDCSIYHDVLLLREVYGDASLPPFGREVLHPEALPASHAVDARGMEDLLTALWQRMLIRMHTFIPDDEDVEAWLPKVFAAHQRAYVDMKRYAEAFASPDPDKVQRFLEEVNFYNRDDDVIRIARAIQRSEPLPKIDPEEAVEAAREQSHYAQALGRAFRYVRAANSFFSSALDEAELKTALDIGIADLDPVE